MSFSNISTQGLRDVVEVFGRVTDSQSFEKTLLLFQAELEKRERKENQESNFDEDGKPIYVEVMPEGDQFAGRKMNGVPLKHLENLLKSTQAKAEKTKDDHILIASIQRTIAWKKNKKPITHMPFGAHKGKPLDEVPHGYLRWLLKESVGPKSLDEDLENAIKAALGEVNN